MPETPYIAVVTDRVPSFVAPWERAFEALGVESRLFEPSDAVEAVEPGGALLVDAASRMFLEDEDALLEALGYGRALGAAVGVQLLGANGVLSGSLPLLEELCRGLVVRDESDVPRVAGGLARRLEPWRAHRFEFVTVSPADEERLLALMGDGRAVLLGRPLAMDDDGSAVVGIAISEDAREAEVELASGRRVLVRALTAAAAARDGFGHGGELDGHRLGQRLRQLRVAAGLTQAELARRTGIHRPNIARVEAGRHTPSLDTLARIAHAIGVSATQVLDGNDG